MKTNQIITASLVGITACTGAVLASSTIYADNDSAVDQITITVPTACTMSGNVVTGQEHSAELLPGTYSGATGSTYENGIGKTTLTTYCNDNNGFSVYAIGFTSNTEGDNTLVGTSASGNSTIATKVYESTDTTSNWSMKVTKVTDTAQTYNPNNMTVTNSFNTWHTVPDDYTKVAEYKSTTEPATTDTTLGAKLETTYATYISTTQPADTYTGQVKYVMVHPYDTTAPHKPVSFDSAYEAAGKQKLNGYYKIQDLTPTICAAVDTNEVGEVVDTRDNTAYHIGKLADDNCWMLDNLALDLVANISQLDEDNTNASNTTLGYLSGTTTRDPSIDPDGKYATAGVTNWTSSYSFSAPLVNISNKDKVPSNAPTNGQGNNKVGGYYNYCAASAGSYCYGNGTSQGTSSGNATEDICPKGWRMPTGNTTGEYSALANLIYGSTGGTSDATAVANYRNALSLPLSGSFYSGSALSQGSSGSFWSSTRYNNSSMYSLYLSTSNVSPADISYRRSGYSMRCILGS